MYTKKTRSSENQWKKSSRKKDEITVAIVTVINAKVDYFFFKKKLVYGCTQ